MKALFLDKLKCERGRKCFDVVIRGCQCWWADLIIAGIAAKKIRQIPVKDDYDGKEICVSCQPYFCPF